MTTATATMTTLRVRQCAAAVCAMRRRLQLPAGGRGSARRLQPMQATQIATVEGTPMRSLLDDSDGDSDSDDGEAMLGRGTAGKLAGVLEGRTLGQALKATSAAASQQIGARPLGGGRLPLGGAASGLAPLKSGLGGSLGSALGGGGASSLAPIGGGAARRFT